MEISTKVVRLFLAVLTVRTRLRKAVFRLSDVRINPFFGVLFLLWSPILLSQPSYATIDEIEIKGFKKTKIEIIERELNFSVGDTISLSDLPQRIERNQQLLMNTGLFTGAKITYKSWNGTNNHIGLLVEVSENWYAYPFPIFELADRNFNVWWEEYNRSLKRVNFGLRFYHINLTGRRDLLKTVGQWGFTQKYEIEYTLPYIDKNQTLGLHTNLLYTRNREIGYNTIDDKLQFHRDADNILLKRFRASVGLIYRPKIDIYQSFMFKFKRNQIHESVPIELNPVFFLNSLRQRYFTILYELIIDKRNIRPYPTAGYYFALKAQKDGLGIFDELNSFYVTGTIKKYFSFSDKWSLEQVLVGRAALIRDNQPYYQSFALGYELDYIRGYELYVIDGLDFIYTKTSIHFELLSRQFAFGKLMPLKPFKVMPLKVFLAINNDFGFTNNPHHKGNNTLSNELLWGYGVGIDLVIYNDKVFQLEYSFNGLSEHGFFLHWELNF